MIEVAFVKIWFIMLMLLFDISRLRIWKSKIILNLRSDRVYKNIKNIKLTLLPFSRTRNVSIYDTGALGVQIETLGYQNKARVS